MKRFQLNKQYALIAFYVFSVIVASLFFALVVFRMGSIGELLKGAIRSVRAIPYGILLALILYPFLTVTTAAYSRVFEKKKQHPRLVSVLSMITVYFGMFLLIGILLLGIIPPMIETVGDLFGMLSDELARLEGVVNAFLADAPLLAGIAQHAGTVVNEFIANILGTDLAATATGLLTTLVGETFDILVGLIISIYLLSGRKMLSAIFGKLVAAILPSGGTHRFTMFVKRLYSNFTEFISARILSALFLGIAAYLLFWACGIPYYALLALIIVVCNLFPVFGTILSLLFCGLVILLTRRAYTLPVLGILIALEIIDNLLIEKRTIPHKDLRPNVGVTLVLMLCGYALLGIVGALLAIPVFATIHNALRAFTIHLLNKNKLPTTIDSYYDFNICDYMDTSAAADERDPITLTEEIVTTLGEATEEALSAAAEDDNGADGEDK